MLVALNVMAIPTGKQDGANQFKAELATQEASIKLFHVIN